MAVERPPAPLRPPSPTLRLVVALLTAARREVVSADRLCAALWGDPQPDAALATLQSHMSRARRLLAPEGAIVGLDGGYRLDLPEGALDADVFARLTRRAREDPDPARAAALHRQALDLWRGPAFGELDDEWLRAEAVRLDELRTATTEDWIECRLADGDDPALIGDLEGLTTANRFRERFVRQLVLALHRDGRQADALRAASRFRALLRDGMGLDPSPALVALEGQVLADDPALRRPGERPTPAARSAPVVDDPTPLVGRERELARIGRAVADDSVVALVGPGGVGKTRLARRVAARATELGDGVAVVELAAVSDPTALLDAVATALDVQPHPQLGMEAALVAALSRRHQLVVLDSCEHVLDDLVPLVDRIRSQCPRVHVLATSREALGLPGEVVLTVPPLTTAPGEGAGPEAVAEVPAVALLLDRVGAAVPGFVLTRANAPVIVEICRRLDGLPLALELVAARFRSLSPETILRRLDGPATVLDASMRSADPRHRTLRDTIAWSYAHLAHAEKVLFARLSTFAGSFDLDAVVAVCGDGSEEGGGPDVVEALAGLVDRSMVQVVADGTRYQLLETLREFGRERLEDEGDAEAVATAHLRWFTDHVERASVGLGGSDEAAWSRRLDADFDDLRRAHGRAVRTGDVDAALRLVAGLREFAFRHIRYELTTWAATSLELPGATAHPRWPVVAAVVSYGHFVRGDLGSSIDEGLQVVAASGPALDDSGLAERALGNSLFYLGRTEEALGWMDRMVASARRGSPARLAHALYMRSVAETSVGGTVQGAILAGEAQATARASGSPTALAQAGYALGLALEGSDPAESLRLLREAADRAGAAGNRWVEAFAETEVWWLEARNGDVRSALTGSGRVIDTWARGGDWANLGLSLRRVFGLLVQVGDHRAAAVLHGALSRWGATTALPFEPSDAEHLDAAVEGVRAALGSTAFAAAVEVGADLSETGLVAYVQERIAAQGT
ncbi:MAG: BTAD domain-containing putative transcriptional regulator [Iamia sp.]